MLEVDDSKYWSKLTRLVLRCLMSARLPSLSVEQLRHEKYRVWPDHSQKARSARRFSFAAIRSMCSALVFVPLLWKTWSGHQFFSRILGCRPSRSSLVCDHKGAFLGYLSGNREHVRIAPWLPKIGITCQRRSLGLMTEEVRSCPRENLSCSRALSLASRDPGACEQFQRPRPSSKKSQRKHALYPRFAGQA